MTSRRRSRLTTIERKRTLKAVVWAVLLLMTLGGLLFYFGVPLLIRMAVFISSANDTKTIESSDDRTLIAAPILDALPEATPSASILVTGYTLADTSVSIVVNGKESDSIAPHDDRSFSVSINLVEGDNVIAAIAKGNLNNSSPSSRQWTVVRDSSPPALTITEPSDGSNRSGASEKKVEVKGQTEENAQITVNGRFVSVGSDDTFLWPMDLKEGENTIEVVATDTAGNKSLALVKVTWTP